ncbi:MAG: hypothetical protein ACLQVD_01285 [Capsulimonadaceae bacterium]
MSLLHPRSATHAAIVCGLLACIVAQVWSPITGTSDVWSHAAVGRWIVEHRAVPTHTLFLFSAHEPWIAHSWASEVLIYLVLARGGDSVGGMMLILGVTVLTFAAFLLAMRPGLDHGRLSPLLLVATPLAVYAGAGRFQIRPEAISALLTAITLFFALRSGDPRPESASGTSEPARTRSKQDGGVMLLKAEAWRFGAGGVGRRLLGSALLFLAWANLHGAVVVGFALIGIQLVGDYWQFRRTDRAARQAAVLLMGGAATCINPYGPHYYAIYSHIHSRVFSYIAEWTPPWQDPVLPLPTLLAAVALTAIAVVAWVRNPGRLYAHLGWLLLGTGLFLQARRSILYMSLIALAVTAWNSRETAVEPDDRPTRPPVFQRLASVAAAVLAVAVIAGSPLVRHGFASLPLAPYGYQPHQIAVLEAVGYTGPILNDYNFSSYMEWRLYGRCTLFIDSQNAYPDTLLPTMNGILTASPEGIAYLDGINAVAGRLKEPGEQGYPPLYQYLATNPAWYMFRTAEGPLWIRRSAIPESAVAQFNQN